MGLLRENLIVHLDTLRAFLLELHRVDSGLYKVDQVDTLLPQPNAFKYIDRDWMSRLSETLGIIDWYLRLVSNWTDHFYTIAFSLGANKEEAVLMRKRELGSFTVFKDKDYDRPYLDSVIKGLHREAEQLVKESQTLMNRGPYLFELIRQFGGPYFEKVLEIGMAWIEVKPTDILTPLQGLMTASTATTTPQAFIQSFGRYLDQIASLVATIPVFVGLETVLNFTDQQMQASRESHQNLITQAQHLESYIEQYHEAVNRLNQHITILLRPVLPADTPVQQWIAQHHINRTAHTNSQIPPSIVITKFSNALKDASETLTVTDSIIDAARLHLTKALPLNAIIQSPALTKVINAAKKRITLYHKWRPSITRTFSTLRASK
jgi:hypothetical protein